MRIIEEKDRLNAGPEAFGLFEWAFRVEPTIYSFAEKLSPDYAGGYWEFYSLGKRGFFMAPTSPESYHASWPDNYSDETVSAEAFGIVCCLFTYSHLSFASGELSELAARVSQQYHLLLDYAASHPEAGAILSLID